MKARSLVWVGGDLLIEHKKVNVCEGKDAKFTFKAC